jgi:hypothetical protein
LAGGSFLSEHRTRIINERRKHGAGVSEINTNVYATQPTRFTIFMRTFVPWQIWRFFWINLRMMLLIGREKHQHK